MNCYPKTDEWKQQQLQKGKKKKEMKNEQRESFRSDYVVHLSYVHWCAHKHSEIWNIQQDELVCDFDFNFAISSHSHTLALSFSLILFDYLLAIHIIECTVFVCTTDMCLNEWVSQTNHYRETNTNSQWRKCCVNNVVAGRKILIAAQQHCSTVHHIELLYHSMHVQSIFRIHSSCVCVKEIGWTDGGDHSDWLELWRQRLIRITMSTATDTK